jgi:hypothetical protein
MSKTALRLQNKKPKQHLQKKYQVKVSVSYTGTVDVEADSKKDAVNIVNVELGEPDNIKFDSDSANVGNTEYMGEVELNVDPKKRHIR